MTEVLQGARRLATAAVLCAAFAALLGGCASGGNVILLPEKDLRQTAISVKKGDQEVVLNQPYAAAKTTSAGPRAYVANAQDVATQFGPALAAQPARAAIFTLYFIEGSDELTEESARIVDSILSEIARRPVPDVLVVGHTDTVGSDQFNDALGRQRAEVVRVALMKLGVPSDDIHALSRGKRAPAILTADGVAEPRNRRVVIIVR